MLITAFRGFTQTASVAAKASIASLALPGSCVANTLQTDSAQEAPARPVGRGKIDGAYLPLVFHRSASLTPQTLMALRGGGKLSMVWL